MSSLIPSTSSLQQMPTSDLVALADRLAAAPKTSSLRHHGRRHHAARRHHSGRSHSYSTSSLRARPTSRLLREVGSAGTATGSSIAMSIGSPIVHGSHRHAHHALKAKLHRANRA